MNITVTQNDKLNNINYSLLTDGDTIEISGYHRGEYFNLFGLKDITILLNWDCIIDADNVLSKALRIENCIDIDIVGGRLINARHVGISTVGDGCRSIRCIEPIVKDCNSGIFLTGNYARVMNVVCQGGVSGIHIEHSYGARVEGCKVIDGGVVSNFIVQALSNQDITVFGDGSQTRSFCYVDDLLEGMIRMMNGPDDFTGPVNLGNPGEFTILELAEMIIRLTGSKSRIIFSPLPQDDPIQRQPDISLAKDRLGWEPKLNLEEGLGITIDYFRDIL